jgi:hypothetical protein
LGHTKFIIVREAKGSCYLFCVFSTYESLREVALSNATIAKYRDPVIVGNTERRKDFFWSIASIPQVGENLKEQLL